MHRIAFQVAGRPSPAPQETDMHIAVLGMAMERYVAAARKGTAFKSIKR